LTDGAGKSGAVDEALSRIRDEHGEHKHEEASGICNSDPMAVFKNFYIFPHEFLSLVLNAKNRLNEIKSSYIPHTNIGKTEHTVIKGEHRYILYDLKPENLRKDYRPLTLLKDDLENGFYANVPGADEG